MSQERTTAIVRGLSSRRWVIAGLVYLTLTAVIFRGILFEPGFIGFAFDWAIPPLVEQLRVWSLEVSNAWLPDYFGSPFFRHNEFLLRILLGIYPLLGLGGEVLSKSFGALLFFLSGVSAYWLARSLRLDLFPSLVSGFFYMAAPPLFNTFITGYLWYDTGYAVTPWVVGLFRNTVSNGKLHPRCIVGAGLLYALASVQPQFVVILALLMLGYTLFSYGSGNLSRYVVALVLVGLIEVTLSVPLLMAMILNTGDVQAYAQEASATWISFKNPPFLETLRLRAAGYTFFNSMADTNGHWAVASWFLPAMAYSSLLARRPNRDTLFWVVMSGATTIYITGSNPPLGELYRWLYFRVPPMWLFRNINSLFVILVLAYAILIATLLAGIRGHFRKTLGGVFHPLGVTASYGAVVAILGLYLQPSLSGDFGGFFSQHSLDQEEARKYEAYVSFWADYRTLQLPLDQPMSFRGSASRGINHFDFPYPFGTLVTGDLRGRYRGYLGSLIYHNYTSRLGHLLAKADGRYIILNRNLKSLYPAYIPSYRQPWLFKMVENNYLEQTLKGQSDIVLLERFGSLDIYRNDSYSPARVSATNELVLAAGSFSALDVQSYLVRPGERPRDILFASSAFFEALSPQVQVGEVYIQDGEFMTLVASALPGRMVIQPASQVPSKVDANLGWAHLYEWWWYNPSFNTPEGAVLSLAKDTFTVSFSAQRSADYEVWAKVFVGKDSSSLSFSLGGRQIGRVLTRTTEQKGYKWVRISNVGLDSGTHTLEVGSEDGENVVASIIIATRPVLEEAAQRVAKLIKEAKLSLVVSARAQEFQGSIYIPSENQYVVSVAVTPLSRDVEQVAEAWKSQLANLKPSIEVDGIKMRLEEAEDMDNAPDVVWFTTKPTSFKEGEHRLKAACPCGQAGILFILARSVGNWADSGKASPDVTYKRLSPAKYEVEVKGAGRSHLLVFQEAYHPGWKAYIDDKDVRPHLLVNAYANGYYMDRTGDYKLVLEYEPQKFFRWALVFSFAALLLYILYLLWDFVGRRRVKFSRDA